MDAQNYHNRAPRFIKIKQGNEQHRKQMFYYEDLYSESLPATGAFAAGAQEDDVTRGGTAANKRGRSPEDKENAAEGRRASKKRRSDGAVVSTVCARLLPGRSTSLIFQLMDCQDRIGLDAAALAQRDILMRCFGQLEDAEAQAERAERRAEKAEARAEKAKARAQTLEKEVWSLKARNEMLQGNIKRLTAEIQKREKLELGQRLVEVGKPRKNEWEGLKASVMSMLDGTENAYA